MAEWSTHNRGVKIEFSSLNAIAKTSGGVEGLKISVDRGYVQWMKVLEEGLW